MIYWKQTITVVDKKPLPYVEYIKYVAMQVCYAVGRRMSDCIL